MTTRLMAAFISASLPCYSAAGYPCPRPSKTPGFPQPSCAPMRSRAWPRGCSNPEQQGASWSTRKASTALHTVPPVPEELRSLLGELCKHSPKVSHECDNPATCLSGRTRGGRQGVKSISLQIQKSTFEPGPPAPPTPSQPSGKGQVLQLCWETSLSQPCRPLRGKGIS